MAMLERGGNAFDAAVATAMTLQVVEPHLNGPGGEVPIIVYDTARGVTEVICGQGVAPAAATIERFAGLGLDLVPGTGLLGACVPGAFDAWMLLLRDYGTLRLREVLEPAIGYAKNGYPVIPRITDTIVSVVNLFKEHWPSSAALYLADGVPRPGATFANPNLAATYGRLLSEAEAAGSDRVRQIERARATWRTGFVAEAIDEFCRREEAMDVSGRPHRGLLTGDDIAKWSATVEEPVSFDYGSYTIHKPGPWSQGPVMLQQLALLAGFDLGRLDLAGPDFIHLQVECAKLAYADREAYYGDPKFVDVPLATLLGDEYNAARRSLVGSEASRDLRPGAVGDAAPVIAIRLADGRREAVSASGAGEPTIGDVAAERGDTVHFDIIDRHGNMVTATPSGGWLQSSPVIPKLGFPLGTRAQMFWLREGLPNSLAPGKRPRTTLSTSLSMRDGQPYLVWGTPGGDQQDQWSTQVFLRHVEAGLNLQEAIEAPAWHTEHFPSSFWPRTARPGVLVIEDRISANTIAALRERGHEVEISGSWTEGRVTAARRRGASLGAAADPRFMQGYAVGR